MLFLSALASLELGLESQFANVFLVLATIGTNGLTMVFELATIEPNGLSMVANQRSNDGSLGST